MKNKKLLSVACLLIIFSGLAFSQDKEKPKSLLFNLSQISYVTLTSVDLGLSMYALMDRDDLMEANPLVKGFITKPVIAITINLLSNIAFCWASLETFKRNKILGISIVLIAIGIKAWILADNIHLLKEA